MRNKQKKPLFIILVRIFNEKKNSNCKCINNCFCRCQQVLQPKGIDIVYIITSNEKTIFDNILHSFVGIAAVQIGLTDVLREIGLVPDKIIGKYSI